MYLSLSLYIYIYIHMYMCVYIKKIYIYIYRDCGGVKAPPRDERNLPGWLRLGWLEIAQTTFKWLKMP